MDDVRFFDKWTHLAMYGGTTMVIWIEYLCCHEKLDRKALFQWVSVAMVLLGGVIELLQEHATTTRSGEWLDFVADVVGVLLGVLAGMVLNRFWFRRR